MNEREILERLQKEVQNAVQQSATPNMPIQFADVTFEVPDDQKYLETVHIPNNPTDRFWGDEKVHRGSFRLILHWPNDSEGAYNPMDILLDISSYFTKDSYYGSLKILNTPDFTGSIKQGSEKLYPINIRYQVFN